MSVSADRDRIDSSIAGPLVHSPVPLVVRPLALDDVTAALDEGMRDFRAAPAFGLLVGAVYALGGNALAWIAGALGRGWMIWPLATGFALLAPVAAVGLYEVGRRRERGGRPALVDLVGRVPPHARRELASMALVTLFGFVVWIYAAAFGWALFFGVRPLPVDELPALLVATPRGALFLAFGTVLGGLLATAMFTITVVSYPLLLDRDVDVVTAMITSVRVVRAAPLVVLGWGAVVAFLLLAAMIPMFLGLVVVLPWLGHATWHVYRRAVA